MEPSMSSHQKDNISWSYVKHAHKTKRGDVEDVDKVVEDDDHDGFLMMRIEEGGDGLVRVSDAANLKPWACFPAIKMLSLF